MYYGDTKERQCSELHMVRKEGGRENGSELDQHRQPSDLLLTIYQLGHVVIRVTMVHRLSYIATTRL